MAVSARELTLILRVQSAGANNIRRMASDLAALEKGGASMNDKFKLASQSIGAVGRQMQLAGGIGTFALGLAANEAAKLQSSVTLAATQVANSTAGVKKQATSDMKGILDQMTKFPTSAEDMSSALYDIYSTLNVTGKQGIPILNQINKAAVAGGLTAKEAGTGLLSIASNFNKGEASVKSVRNEFNRMFAAVRYGRVNMQEFATSLQTTAPAAKLAGQSLDSMSGTVAFLSRSLGPGKASVGYARLVEVLSGTQMQEGLKKVGVNIDTANGKMKQMDQVIQILVKRFPYLAQGGIKALNFFKDIGNIQSTIQARRAFATLVKDVGGYRMILGKTVNDNKEFAKSYATMSQTLGVQWGVFLNTLKSLATTVGLAVIPAFVEMSKPIRQAVAWFQNLSQSTKDMIGRLAAFIAVGALVGGTLLTIVAGAAVFVASIGELATAAAALSVGLGTYLAFAGIAKKIYDNWHELGPMFMELAKHLKDMLEALGKAVADFYHGDWNALWSHLGDAIQAAIPSVTTALHLLEASVIAWGKEFVTSIQGLIALGISGMFLKRGLAGGGAGLAGKAGTALSATDLLSLAVGSPVGPLGMMTKGATKADDVKQALERSKIKDKIAGMTKADLEKTIAVNEYSGAFTGGSKNALEDYAAMLERQQSGLKPKLAKIWAPFISPMSAYSTSARAAEDAKLKQYWALQAASAENYAQQVKRAEQARTMMSAGLPSTAAGLAGQAPKADQAIADAEKAASRATPALSGMEKAGLGVAAMGTSLASGAAVAEVAIVGLTGALAMAGKGMLKFIGFGNVWLGALIAVTAGAYVGGNAIRKLVDGFIYGADNMQKFTDKWNATTDAVSSFRGNITAAAQSFSDMQTQKADLGHLTRQMNQQTAALGKLTPGTKQFNAVQKELTATTKAHAAANLQLLQSQQTANEAMAQSNSAALTASKGIDSLTSGKSIRGSSFDDLKKNLEAWANAVHTTIQSLIPNVQALNAAIASGAKAKDMKPAFAEISSTYAMLLHQGKAWRDNLTQVQVATGHAFDPAELQYFAQNIKRDILPGVTMITRHLHALPSRVVLNFLSNHKSVQLGVAAIVSQFHRLPKRSELKLLLNNKQAEGWIAQFINKFHKLPSQHQITIHMKTVRSDARDLAKAQQNVGQLQRAAHQTNRTEIGFSTDTNALTKAKNQLNNLNRQAEKKHKISLTFSPNPSKIASSYQSLVGKMKGIGTAGGQGWAKAFTANATATANAHVNLTIAAFHKSWSMGSPSKVAEKKIGDPILQGIIKGINNKKDISDAANTAMTTMVSAFESNKSLMQDQMGALFAGPSFMPANKFPDSLQQKLGFGEKVNIKDLQGDLRAQTHEYTKFQRGLGRLDRRKGTSAAFIDSIRQLGPAAQSELTALLNATPKQLKKYEKLWEKSQKEINKGATKATKGQFKIYASQGKQVALGFLSGLTSMQPSLERYFRNIFLHLFHSVKKTHKSHSPSQLYAEEGRNVVRGFEMGAQREAMRSSLHSVLTPPVGRGHHRGPQVACVTNNYYNRTYNVYPLRNENLLTALRKHDYVTRVHP